MNLYFTRKVQTYLSNILSFEKSSPTTCRQSVIASLFCAAICLWIVMIGDLRSHHVRGREAGTIEVSPITYHLSPTTFPGVFPLFPLFPLFFDSAEWLLEWKNWLFC